MLNRLLKKKILMQDVNIWILNENEKIDKGKIALIYVKENNMVSRLIN